MKRRANVKAKVVFGAGSFGQGIIFTLVSLYLMFYLTQVQGLSGSIVGTAFLIFRCWDGINDPIMGAIVCKLNMKMGKYRPWLLIGSLFSGFLFVLMFVDVHNFSLTMKYVYYLGLYFLWGMAYTIVEIPYWSLIPATTIEEADRNSITSISQVFNNIGTLAVSILAPSMLDVNDPSSFLILALQIGLVYIFSLSMTTFCVKEKRVENPEIITFKQMVGAFKKNDQARALFWPVFFMSTAFNLTISLGTYFFTYDIGDTSKFSLFMIFAGTALVIGILSYPFVASKFGRKNIFIFSSVMCIIGYSFMFAANMLFHGDVYVLSGVSIFALISFGWIMVARYIMASAVCDYSERKTGQRMNSIWISINSLSIKISSAFVAFLTGVTLDITSISGKEPTVLSADSILILRIMMFVIPIALVGIGLLCYVTRFKLDNPNFLERIKCENDVENKEENKQKEIDVKNK